jgi:predicted nucleic acid-binding protein
LSLLCDASSIFHAALGEDVSSIASSVTLDLAVYELGNILWKQRVIFKSISIEECDQLLKILNRVLGTITLLQPDGLEGEILRLAEETHLSFYDSSYLYFARRLGCVLITEDDGLLLKAGQTGVEARSLREIQEAGRGV